jgi:hypothetical protein
MPATKVKFRISSFEKSERGRAVREGKGRIARCG